VDPINVVDAAFLSCTIASNIDLLSASLKQVEPAHLQGGFGSLVLPNCLSCVLRRALAAMSTAARLLAR
jgi:hypothetical protein